MIREPGREHGEKTGDRLRAELVDSAAAGARDEVVRTDTKAGNLLALASAAFAGLVTFANAKVPPAAATALWVSAALDAAAVAMLLVVIRPQLRGTPRGGMLPSHQMLLTASPADLHRHRAGELRIFSELAVTKHRHIRLAVDLLLIALAALIIAALIIVTH